MKNTVINNKMKIIKLTSLLSAVLISSMAVAEMPVSAQKHMNASAHSTSTNTHTTNYATMTAAHNGINTKKNQPFWSEKQKPAQELEAKLLKLIESNTANKRDYARLANLYLANNKTMKAIPAYQDAINHDQTNAKLFAGISIAYLHQSKYSMAKAMADQAITLDPEMKHAMKIKEYIEQKEEIIAQASQRSTMPVDSNHKKGTH